MSVHDPSLAHAGGCVTPDKEFPPQVAEGPLRVAEGVFPDGWRRMDGVLRG